MAWCNRALCSWGENIWIQLDLSTGHILIIHSIRTRATTFLVCLFVCLFGNTDKCSSNLRLQGYLDWGCYDSDQISLTRAPVLGTLLQVPAQNMANVCLAYTHYKDQHNQFSQYTELLIQYVQKSARYTQRITFCWPGIIVYQCSETNVMHFLFNLLRIKGLYMFRALLAHPQEALHSRHLVYCERVMSVGCTRIEAQTTWCTVYSIY
jgi:hypothetical protein